MPCYFLLTELCCYGKTYRIPFGLTHGGKREQCTTKSALIYKLLYLFEVFYLPLLLFDTGMEKNLIQVTHEFCHEIRKSFLLPDFERAVNALLDICSDENVEIWSNIMPL